MKTWPSFTSLHCSSFSQGFAALAFSAILALGSVLWTAPSYAQAPVTPGSVKIKKITTQVVKTPEFNVTGGPQKRSKLGDWVEIEVEFDSAPEIIDELTFKYTVLAGKQILDGEVTHINIPRGDGHYSVMYISPRSIERLVGRGAPTGLITNVWIEVTKQGQKIAADALAKGAMPNLPHLTGMLMNKGETPFAPLFWDRYEAIKPGGSR